MMKQAIFFPGSMRIVITELLPHMLKAFSHRTAWLKILQAKTSCWNVFGTALKSWKSQKQQQLATHSTQELTAPALC